METQVFNLVREQDNLNETKRKFSKYFDPNFIFKIKLEYEVIGKDGKEKKKNSLTNSVINFLEGRGINIISPSPEGNGYWVSIADDEELKELRKSLEKYALGICKYSQLDMIEEMFIPIPPEDKIGPRLKDNPLSEDEDAYLDVEIWRMDNERLNRFLWGGDDGKEGFNKYISKKGGRVTDTFITENLCLLRVKVNKELFEEILQLREICTIDRPPKPDIHHEIINIPLDDIDIEGEPPENSTGIAILDSGILSSHPLLKNAVGDATYVPLNSNNKIKEPKDDVGHGTGVAGIALYGDIKECIVEKKFQPEVWIFSAKIMYNNEGDADFDPDELLEHQLERAVRYFVENHPNCKIINLSLGVEDQNMFNNHRQFPLATLIDELAKELNVIFVVSSGNFIYCNNGTHVSQLTEHYPRYLLKDIKDVKIINPASSAYAITVGALSPDAANSEFDKILRPFVEKDYPSMITRAGPGYKGMIKPELVEVGGTPLYYNGGYEDNRKGKVIVLNHNYISDGRLFTVDCGTSFSAPKVAHYLARLYNKYPNASSNLIKALFLSSAEIPDNRPVPLDNIQFTSNTSTKKVMKLLNIYGYGKPNFERAVASNENDVLLVAENRIKPDDIHLYYFNIPKEFIDISCHREISVTLTYNPPINRNRIDYMGVSMEFHLYNENIDDVLKWSNRIKQERDFDNIESRASKLKELNLLPGVDTRKKGIHQKGIIKYTRKPGINPEKPLVLAVVCSDKWVGDENYLQDYAIVVRIKHKAKVDLYNKIRQNIPIKERVKVR